MRPPLATDISSRDGTLAKDSLMKNAFAEKVGEEFDVFKRPGLTQAYDLGSGQGQGLVSWKGSFFTARGNALVQGPTASQVADGTAWTQKTTCPISADTKWSDGTYLYGMEVAPLGAVYRTQDGVAWSQVTALVTGLAAAADYTAIYHNSAVYVFPFNATAIYKSITDGASWSLVSASPSYGTKNSPALASTTGKLWLLGGSTTTAAGGVTNQVWLSTDNGANWTQKTAAAGWAARFLASAVYHNNKLWIAGGQNSAGTNLNDVWYSSDDGANWTQATASAAWSIRNSQAMLVYNNKMVIGGGSASNVDDFYTSSDGATWTAKNSNISGVASGSFLLVNSTSVFVLYPTGGQLYMADINAAGGDDYTLTGASNLPISFSQTSGSASTEYLFLKTTGKAWVLTFGQPGTLTAVTDVDYPATTVPGAVYLDGYFFVMTPAGEIYNCALEDPTSWGALDFISAEIEPDDAVAIAKHMNYVVALKSTTTELFYDAANASGSPLARLSNAAIQVGCANGYSIAALDAGLFFISRFRSNQKSVHYFPKDGLQPVEIASPSIKRILTAADTTTVHCFAAQLNGHSFYVITLVTEALTLAYDLTTQTWSQWTFLTVAAADSVSSLTQSGGIATAIATAHGFADGDPVTIAGATPSGYNATDVNIKCVDANTFTYPVSSALSTPATGTITATGWTEGYFPFGFYTNALSKDYVQHETSGKVYEISSDYGDDAGAPIDVTVRTPPLNQGSINRKTMARLSVVGDNTTGTLLVRYSDDDYVTFSKYRPIDLSTTNKQVRRLGDYRERALDFRYTGDNKIRIRSIDIE